MAQRRRKLWIVFFLWVGVSGCQIEANNKARLERLKNPSAGTLTVVPNGSNGKTYGYQVCSDAFTFGSTSPSPGAAIGGNETEFTSSLYSQMSAADSSFALTECTAGFSTRVSIQEFYIDVTSLNISQYSSFDVSWTGRLGMYTGTCSGASDPTENAPNFTEISVWNGSNWVNLNTSILATTQTITVNIAPVSTYVVSNLIWVRVAGSVTATNCSIIQTDQLKYVLRQ